MASNKRHLLAAECRALLLAGVFISWATASAPASAQPQAAAPPPPSYAAQFFADFPGQYDYVCPNTQQPGICKFGGRPADVATACNNDLRCAGFAYDFNQQAGFLKAAPPGRSTIDPTLARTNANAVFYYKPDGSATDYTRLPSIYQVVFARDVRGNDFGCQGDANLCKFYDNIPGLATYCNFEARCKAFTYNIGDYSGYLKGAPPGNSVVTPSDTVFTTNFDTYIKQSVA